MNSRTQAKIISLLILLAGVAIISGLVTSWWIGLLACLVWGIVWRTEGEPRLVDWWSER